MSSVGIPQKFGRTLPRTSLIQSALGLNKKRGVIIRRISQYDEQSIARLASLQRERAWDLEKSIAWETRIDLNKPLVPLDEDAILFPGASREERLAISQMMGLIIASSIFELEECLIHLKHECWDKIHRRFPVSPEFTDLGELFFIEERKHSTVFRRYVDKFAEEAGIDPAALRAILPQVRKSKTEFLIKQDLKSGGQSFWWIVAIVEQEFLLIYHALRPFRSVLEPLYFSIHEKHFEEEARHSPFPYLMLDLMKERSSVPLHGLRNRVSLVVAQLLQAAWAVSSLQKIRQINKMKKIHPLFDAFSNALPLLDRLPKGLVLWRLLTNAPYVSSLLNPSAHHKILRFASQSGALTIPFPEYENKKLVNY